MAKIDLDKVQERLDALGISPRAASLKATGKPDTIRNIQRAQKGGTRAGNVRTDTLYKLADALECHASFLLKHDENFKNRTLPKDNVTFLPEGETKKHLAGRPVAGRDLPVLGSAVCGADGEFYMNGEIIEYVARPQVLQGDPNGYAVRSQGDSMIPRFYDGDLCLIKPSEPIRHLCFVLVQVAPENDGDRPTALLKQFIKKSNDILVLHQFNPVKDIHIDVRRVISIHRVL